MTTITIDRAVVEQALEALENWRKGPHDSVTRRGNTTRSDVAIAFLRAALAKEQADPTDPGHDVEVLREHVRHLERRVRQLAQEQATPPAWLDVARAIERKVRGEE